MTAEDAGGLAVEAALAAWLEALARFGDAEAVSRAVEPDVTIERVSGRGARAGAVVDGQRLRQLGQAVARRVPGQHPVARLHQGLHLAAPILLGAKSAVQQNHGQPPVCTDRVVH